MTNLVKAMLEQLKSKEYRKLRSSDPEAQPILYPVELFGFNMGYSERTEYQVGNVTLDYATVITEGFEATKSRILAAKAKHTAPEKLAFADKMLSEIDRMIAISDAHRKLAEDKCPRLFEALGKIPRKGAESFYEACVFIKLINVVLRRRGVQHLGLGRFDQYMMPFWQADLDRGVTKEELFETLEAFFIALNYDSDVYGGMQQGDNGQSMVLGGFDEAGNYLFNDLSKSCMEASLELNLIDPKINLRVGKNTPDEIYVLGTELTKKGLGFPQYCNDDVVIPGLIKLGYDKEDAYNYVVAACWEFIIPGVGADIPNIRTMNFPLMVANAVSEGLVTADSFDDLLALVDKQVIDCCEEFINRKYPDLYDVTASIFIGNCIERLQEMHHGGAKYFNFGCHGAGIANAADALAAIKKCVYEDGTVSKEELLAALEADFEGFEALRNKLKACPKMGNNDNYVDDIATHLMDVFSRNLNNRSNLQGGIWRAGTGSAMEYLLSAAKCPATADGRKAGDVYSSSFSPSLDVKTEGILSVIQSFTKFDMTNIANGGPLTLEIHDTVLRNEIGIAKTAKLVQLFVELGGHQLQLNSINRDVLLDAQKHPENYPNLIVRVWGWSGYFNELDLPYQEHIIRRTHYAL